LYVYRGLSPVASFLEAISAAKPDLLVSGDDLATWHLHDLYKREKLRGISGTPICDLIERSLGDPQGFPVVYSRAAFMDIAEQEGIRVPRTRFISNRDDLKNWITSSGFPMVLKANGTSGGNGVRVIDSRDEADRAFKSLQAPPLLARAAKRALLDRDSTLVWPSLLRQRSVVNAQSFVQGHEATSSVVCHRGQLLARVHFEVLAKEDSSGPATVLRRIEHPEMEAAAEKMVRRLNLSGIHGFDFMLETQTNHAYLIEINPRATQVGHLTFGPGRDLPAALFSLVTGSSLHASRNVTEKDTIALFPREWLRDPHSKYLVTAYHDVPWEEPSFILACVGKHGQQSIRRLQKGWQQGSAVGAPRP
jgi:acetyl/propionyl-CoA carboxylase alpha subunit